MWLRWPLRCRPGFPVDDDDDVELQVLGRVDISISDKL